MTTLELRLDDDLQAFVTRQSKVLGHPSTAAYIESLLAIEKLKHRASTVEAQLKEADGDQTELVDDEYWRRLESDVFHKASAETNP
jgi:hypothetical protein